MREHQIFFSVSPQNKQLADLEEIFTEFDSVRIGLEWMTAPLRHLPF